MQHLRRGRIGTIDQGYHPNGSSSIRHQLFCLARQTSNVHRPPIHLSLDKNFGHHFQFSTFRMIGSIHLPYALISRRRCSSRPWGKTAFRSTVMSINLENQEGILEISFVLSGSVGYFPNEHLTFFHSQKNLFIRCQLHKDAAKRYTESISTFNPLRYEIDDQLRNKRRLQARILGEQRAGKNESFARLGIRSSKKTTRPERFLVRYQLRKHVAKQT